jgi:hypothetical protein
MGSLTLCARGAVGAAPYPQRVTTSTPREGRELAEGPFEGVPDHLGAPLLHWLRWRLIDPAPLVDFRHTGPTVQLNLIHRATLAGRIRLPGHPEPMTELNHLLGWWQQDPERFLDFIHYLLQEPDVDEDDIGALDQILERGGSVWRATDRGLQRRVDPVATAAFEMAASPRTPRATSWQWRGRRRTDVTRTPQTPGITRSRRSRRF